MPFNPERYGKSYRSVTGEYVPPSIGAKLLRLGKTEASTPKADIIFEIIDETIEAAGEKAASLIMENCGTQCIGNTVIEKAKRIYRNSNTMSDFIDTLNSHHIGGGRLKLEDGIVTGGYDRCYCGSVRGIKRKMPLAYCKCSAGWYKRLFEEALGREVKVEILNSIISGSNICDFRIEI